MPDREPLLVDLTDFDAVGLVTDVVVRLRIRSIEADVDAAATVAAPEGWHRVVVTARPSGHVVVAVRFTELSASRWHNVAEALDRRGWQLDEDREGASRRFPPGTEATDAAFEVLAAAGVAGAPGGTRSVTAVDGTGHPVELG